jgi:hypothetical protein
MKPRLAPNGLNPPSIAAAFMATRTPGCLLFTSSYPPNADVAPAAAAAVAVMTDAEFSPKFKP